MREILPTFFFARAGAEAYSYRSHQFRSLFKTEASVPDRGIDRDCVEFMMGHLSGIERAGNVYNRVPEIYSRAVEAEYAKLEPWINIYSSTRTRETEFTTKEVEMLKTLARNEKILSKWLGSKTI